MFASRVVTSVVAAPNRTRGAATLRSSRERVNAMRVDALACLSLWSLVNRHVVEGGMLRLRSTMLAAALLGTATLTHAQDDKASWTFDTYTPGVCSANGGKHGGCPAGDLVK